jgi:hypothetical protein
VRPDRRLLAATLAAALGVVAALTLLPAGRGWSWGSPATELRWYLTGLDSTATTLQLAGNLGLLTAPAVLAVLLWPRLGRPGRLGAAALAAGIAIELLQWALPLGRVVSPLDALLNATGALAVSLLVARTRLGSVRVRAGVLVERAGEEEGRRHVPR